MHLSRRKRRSSRDVGSRQHVFPKRTPRALLASPTGSAHDYIGRAEEVAKIARAHAAMSTRTCALSRRGVRGAEGAQASWHAGPDGARRRGRARRRRRGRLRDPRRGLRLDGDDFRDASGQARLPCWHSRGNAWQLDFLRKVRREAVAARLLDHRGHERRQYPLERRRRSSSTGARVRLVRDASCISYGAEADAIVTTARRGESAANSDQVLVVLRARDYTLEPTKSWDTLGMRGTCSVGYMLRAEGVRRSGAARALRSHPQPDDGALCASVLVVRLVRRRHRRVRRRPAPSCARPRAMPAAACRRARSI